MQAAISLRHPPRSVRNRFGFNPIPRRYFWPRGKAAALLLCALPLAGMAMRAQAPGGAVNNAPGTAAGRTATPGEFFRVAQIRGVWWFIRPDGRKMISAGVDHVSFRGDGVWQGSGYPYRAAVMARYGRYAAWKQATERRLRAWGFNTIGAWSDRRMETPPGLPYTIVLDIAARAGANWKKGRVADFYSPQFEQAARRLAARICRPHRNDPNLLGYFSDNELRWGADWRGKQTLLAMYLALPADAPGRQAAVAYLKREYFGRIAALDSAWGVHAAGFRRLRGMGKTAAYRYDARQFLRQAAGRYFQICAKAIHAADPNHLYLGARIAWPWYPAVLAAAKWADVVSVNIYARDPRPVAARAARLSGRPVMVTEFAFRARDAVTPNLKGAGPRVANQRARGEAYAKYVERLESLPQAVGYHWFEWCDEPRQGRALDGEDSNYGLVRIHDRRYRRFVRLVSAANRQAAAEHGSSHAGRKRRGRF